MITLDDYPLYNGRERPGIGRSHTGELSYNCFSVRLEREAERYQPFLFTHFLAQYSAFSGQANTCSSCIAQHSALSFKAESYEIDRSAVVKKFAQGDPVDDAEFYYCPMMQQVIAASTVTIVDEQRPVSPPPATQMTAILSGTWDDQYLFEFAKIGWPADFAVCDIIKSLLSDRFISTPAEKSFFLLWMLSMFGQIEAVRQAGQRVFLEDTDFSVATNKLYRFLFPIPQVWIYVIPKAPAGQDWQTWEQNHRNEGLPQRVDFMFTYAGVRHVVEIDDRHHYATNVSGRWLASEEKYRQTIGGSRLLKRSGFEVHRFTNEEILELYDPSKRMSPNVSGFLNLLRSSGLDASEMIHI